MQCTSSYELKVTKMSYPIRDQGSHLGFWNPSKKIQHFFRNPGGIFVVRLVIANLMDLKRLKK